MSLESHLLFIFVLTLTYKECLKVEKEGWTQPYHKLTLKTALGNLQSSIKLAERWESEQLDLHWDWIKLLHFETLEKFSEQSGAEGFLLQLILLGKLMTFPVWGPARHRDSLCFFWWPDCEISSCLQARIKLQFHSGHYQNSCQCPARWV